MMSAVVDLGIISRLDLPAERILNAAQQAELQDVVVIGYDADGELYVRASNAAGPEVLWLLERARRKLHQVTDDLEAS